MTVLVVEDNPEYREVIQHFLQSRFEKCRVLTAKNGNEGLEKIRKEDPDVVVMDLRLPDIDGFTIISATHNLRSSLPFIAMTAEKEETRRLRQELEAHQISTLAFLEKPFEPSELELLVQRAMEFVKSQR